MGYFSGIAGNGHKDYYDVSCNDHRQQLLWRYDDLQDRLEELQEKGAAYSNSTRYTRDDLRYALPRELKTVQDVVDAVEMVSEELLERYKINVQPIAVEEPDVDEITGNQLSFHMICNACSLPMAG